MDATSGRDDWLDRTQILREVDAACDRFEASWRAGDRPLIEDFLEGTSDAQRRELFRYLLAVELDYRSSLRESPESSEYQVRFPGHETLIDSVFAEFAQRSKLARKMGLDTLELRTRWDGTSSRGAPAPLSDLVPNIPGCTILSELGRGGMGVVYKARQMRLNRLCALKIVLPGKHPDAEARARFLAEAETIARFKHPNIVQIYSLGEHDGRPYFEMEYIEGGSLARRLDGTPWAPAPAARLVAILARAIGDAHRLGIIHRDLKPANVLLTDDDHPKLVDFGLAKSLEADQDLTESGVFLGTPSYAAPEQVEASSRAVGPATDIYALGAIFYQMLTGRPPFQGATVLQTLEQVQWADPVPPSRLQPGLPRDAETIAMKCLEKDPERRYADAAALAEDLNRFLAGRPIVARPAGAAEHLRKWIRRRPAVALLSATLVAVTLLGFILVSWQWRCAETKTAAVIAANERAQRARRDAFEEEAQLTLHQALALCDQGEVRRGLSWLARSLELATEARAEGLDRPIRINLADWAGQMIQPLRRPPMRHSAPILDLAFCREGKALLSVGRDGVVRIWDAATGNEVEPSLDIKSDPSTTRLERARFGLAESQLLGAVDTKGRASVWDLNRRQRLASAEERTIRGIAVLSARSAIACDESGMLHWWETGHPPGMSASQPIEGLPARRSGETAMALSADGRTLVSSGPGQRVVRWDVATRGSIEPELHHDSPVEAIALAPDGRTIITGRRAGRLHVWNAETERGFDLPPQGTAVTSLAVSPDGRVFASGTEGGVIRLWDTSLLGQLGQTCKLAGAVTALAFDPRGRVLAIGEGDGTIWLCALPRQQALGRHLQVNAAVQTLSFSKDGRHLLVGTAERAQGWDLACQVADASCRESGGHCNEMTSREVEPTIVSPDGRTLATARRVAAGERTGGRIELRDAATGRALRQTDDQPDPVSGLVYSPDSKWLLAWGPGPSTARLWDVASLRDSRPLLRTLDSPIQQAQFSRDGRCLLLGCRDGKARRWDLHRDVEIHSGRQPFHAYPITAVTFDPTRSRLVTGCHAGTVRFWDSTRGTMLYELRQNAGEIVVLAFSPDGTMLLTASHDGTARFLDAESGRQLGPALRHADAVLCVAFHPDGQSVVTGTRDGMVQRWSVPSHPESGEAAEIRRRVRLLTGAHFDGSDRWPDRPS